MSAGVHHNDLAARAESVLKSNDIGAMTTAAPMLYPHMWSWDAAFISIGLATVSVPRAITEMDTLFAAQWSNGMIPHIVFSPGATTYFPAADRWETARLADAAPTTPETSGICQPPVHALAVQHIVAAGEAGNGEDRSAVHAFLDRAWPRLVAWHRWLADVRDPEKTGRVTIHHGWESGMDNSPRWDAPYSRVRVDSARLPPYERKDSQFVDANERPSDEEYDRYLWLIQEMKEVRYDDRRVRESASFAVEDVFFSAILCVACEVLVELGERYAKPPEDVSEMRLLADRFRAGVAESVDPENGHARDRDLRTGQWLESDSVAVFAPLLCRALDRAPEQRLLDLFWSPGWCGHPEFRAAQPPSTSPESAAFRASEYWRGPQWPVVAWLFSWAFARNGWTDESEKLRSEGLRLLERGEFGEYYEPFTGAPLGSHHQSWTAAVALAWLSAGGEDDA